VSLCIIRQQEKAFTRVIPYAVLFTRNESLDPAQVSNVKTAVGNARAFAAEVITKLCQDTAPTKVASLHDDRHARRRL
jgi:hypothetical protein